MLSVFNVLKEFKEYYKVEKQITFGGWLSTADKQKGNWKKSIPLYEKVGKLTNVESYFNSVDYKCQYKNVTF